MQPKLLELGQLLLLSKLEHLKDSYHISKYIGIYFTFNNTLSHQRLTSSQIK